MKTVVNIHESLNELIEERKDLPEPPTLKKPEDETAAGGENGATEEILDQFDEQFDRAGRRKG